MSHVENLVRECLTRGLTVTFRPRTVDIETPLSANVSVRSSGGSHDGSVESVDALCKALVEMVAEHMPVADDRKPEGAE
jgi:hypothetical protein